ncbi:MAG: helix-turn-helix domain-containing protein [Acidobacteria bacterium]|nr:helix-turn-helix domain-containing protein [Acidobacteriota bacterium]
MQRTQSKAMSSEDPAARPTTISGPVLPRLQKRRSPEQAARISTKRHLLEFVQMLETRRAELGLSRSAIARQLGVTQPTISRLFSGHVQNIELKTMVRVAEVLDADLKLVIKPRPPLRSRA